jgi:ankyrin repeat protein
LLLFLYFSHAKTSNYTCRGCSFPPFLDDPLYQKYKKAIQQNDYVTVRKLIKKEHIDIDLEIRFDDDSDRMTALQFACKSGSVGVVDELIANHCDLNKCTAFEGTTALILACSLPDEGVAVDVVRIMLHAGANPNKSSHFGRVPLIMASEFGWLSLVRILLRYGAKIDLATNIAEYPDEVQHILEMGNLSEKEGDEIRDPYSGNTALMQASREHHESVVQELIRRNSTLNLQNAMRNTALHIACKSQSLTTHLANASTHRAPLAGNVHIVRMLIDGYCDMNVKNKHGETALKRAIEGIFEVGRSSLPMDMVIPECLTFCAIVSELILAGCDVNGIDCDNQSALSCLLSVVSVINSFDSKRLENAFASCISQAIAAGCRPTTVDQAEVTALVQKQSKEKIKGLPMSDILRVLEHFSAQSPQSLKHLARTSLRKHMRKPIDTSLLKLRLPTILIRFVGLQLLF